MIEKRKKREDERILNDEVKFYEMVCAAGGDGDGDGVGCRLFCVVSVF